MDTRRGPDAGGHGGQVGDVSMSDEERRERQRARQNARYANDPEYRARKIAYAREHGQDPAYRERMREWMRTDPAYRERKAASRAASPLRNSEAASSAMRAYLLARDGRACGLCGDPIPSRETPSIDHIIAVALGGSDEPSNLRLTHLVCNQRAGVTGSLAPRASSSSSSSPFSNGARALAKSPRLHEAVPESGLKRTIVRYRDEP